LAYFNLFIGLFTAWLLGYIIICFFDAARKTELLERMALSYLVGQGALTLLLFLLFLLPITNRLAVTAAVVLGLFFLRLFLDRRRWSPEFFTSLFGYPRTIKYKKLSLGVVMIMVLMTGIAFKISYSLIEACSKPEYSWDAAGNWTDHGKNFYYADKYRPQDMVSPLINTASSYPKSISLMHYWLFSWMGQVNDQWSKIIFPLELVCLLIIFYYGLKPIRGQLGAAVFVYFLCSCPLLLYHATIGYADLTKTVYFSAGIIYFYRWLTTKQNNYFWFFAILLACVTWVKLEGKTLYAIGLALLVIYLWLESGEPLKNKLLYVVKYLSLFIFIGLPWQLFTKLMVQVPDPQSNFYFVFPKIIELHQKIYSLMFLDGTWGLFWVIFAAGCLLFFKRQIGGKNIYLLLAVLLFYGNLLFIYLCFYRAIPDMVATFNRVLLPIYPVAVFNLGCVIPIFAINKELKA
jgi:hypothetical protein